MSYQEECDRCLPRSPLLPCRCHGSWWLNLAGPGPTGEFSLEYRGPCLIASSTLRRQAAEILPSFFASAASMVAIFAVRITEGAGSPANKRPVTGTSPDQPRFTALGRANPSWASRANRSRVSRRREDPQHAPQRLGRAPQQLVADRKRRQVLAPHRQLAQRGRPAPSACRSPLAGVSSRDRDLALVRHHLAPSRCRPRAGASISASGTSCLSLIVSAWLWQRMAPMRTQMPSTGIGLALRPRILLVSALPFHSSRLWPLPRSLSIQGIRLPASGTPKLAVGNRVAAQDAGHVAVDVEDGATPDRRSSVCAAADAPRPSARSSSRMFCAPAPEAAW